MSEQQKQNYSNNNDDRQYTQLDKDKLVDDDQWKQLWAKKAEWQLAKKYVSSRKNQNNKNNTHNTNTNGNTTG